MIGTVKLMEVPSNDDLEVTEQASHVEASFSGESKQNNDRLITHTRIHTEERLLKCGERGKPFKRRVHLLYHKVAHTGKKPLKFKEYGKGFSRKSNLKSHVRIHNGKKPFKCGQCG